MGRVAFRAMDFEYHDDENESRDPRPPTEEDERYVYRILIIGAIIAVAVLLLIYLLGGSIDTWIAV